MSNAPETPPDSGTKPPEGWQASVTDFLSARVELIRMEARDASRQAAQKGALVGIAAASAFLCWMLITAGLIGLISAYKPEWPWYGVALAFGLLYLLITGIAYMLFRKPGTEAFSLTRSELAKDREWINRLNNSPKSPN